MTVARAFEKFHNSTLSRRYAARDDIQPIYATGLTAIVLHGTSNANATDSNSSVYSGDEQVAIKIVDKEKILTTSGSSASELPRAQFEAKLHESLPWHPHIVPLLAMEETQAAVILITPYLPSGDLWDKIRYGDTILESEGRNFLAQVLRALDVFHNQLSLIHGDMKPHNLLLREDHGKFIVQLCDFGLTEKVDLNPRTKKFQIPFTGLRGTSGYFAPEMIDQCDYGFAIDVFALGVILFRMLAGYEPFYPPTNFADGPLFDENYWGHISAPCRDLVNRMLAVDPDARISVAHALAHPWIVEQPETKPVSIGFGAPPNEALKFHDPVMLGHDFQPVRR
ncbi:unnamed protein product [Amoebophrya sp. A120]|nr:unnamed protein product [Amoebophrya sp. A120]|eukprot:GSA120T00016032001.1